MTSQPLTPDLPPDFEPWIWPEIVSTSEWDMGYDWSRPCPICCRKIARGERAIRFDAQDLTWIHMKCAEEKQLEGLEHVEAG